VLREIVTSLGTRVSRTFQLVIVAGSAIVLCACVALRAEYRVMLESVSSEIYLGHGLIPRGMHGEFPTGPVVFWAVYMMPGIQMGLGIYAGAAMYFHRSVSRMSAGLWVVTTIAFLLVLPMLLLTMALLGHGIGPAR